MIQLKNNGRIRTVDSFICGYVGHENAWPRRIPGCDKPCWCGCHFNKTTEAEMSEAVEQFIQKQVELATT